MFFLGKVNFQFHVYNYLPNKSTKRAVSFHCPFETYKTLKLVTSVKNHLF